MNILGYIFHRGCHAGYFIMNTAGGGGGGEPRITGHLIMPFWLGAFHRTTGQGQKLVGYTDGGAVRCHTKGRVELNIKQGSLLTRSKANKQTTRHKTNSFSSLHQSPLLSHFLFAFLSAHAHTHTLSDQPVYACPLSPPSTVEDCRLTLGVS